MRPIPIAAIVVLAAAFSTTVATGAPATRAATCGSGFGPTKYSTTQTIEGKTLIVNCGPATAKVRYKGKTYAFKNGTCFRYLGAFKLNLGESLVVPGPHKGPYSSMTINTGPGGHVEIGMGVGKISIYAAVKSSGVGVKGRFSSITAGVPSPDRGTAAGRSGSPEVAPRSPFLERPARRDSLSSGPGTLVRPRGEGRP